MSQEDEMTGQALVAEPDGEIGARAGEVELTRKQQRFVDEYLVDLNGTQAAIRAGYSADSARSIAHENLTKPDIAAAIDAALAATPGITRTRIVNELGLIAFANMADYITVQDDGTAYVDLSKLTREQAAAIGEIITETYTEGRGEAAREVKRVKFKLADKLSALEKLGKTLGMFKDRYEHSGPNGKPIQYAPPAIEIVIVDPKEEPDPKEGFQR